MSTIGRSRCTPPRTSAVSAIKRLSYGEASSAGLIYIRPTMNQFDTEVPPSPSATARQTAVPPSASARQASSWLPALLVLFIGSGCAALIYEVVWFQLLQLSVGSSA